MANMIIKPAVGGNLLIQDRAGGAVLSTGTSGATIANATLNSPTLVTPALGTPASGVMTNMTGTPSAINLANAAFPAGHIVQMVNGLYQGSDIGTNGTSFQEANSSLRCTITPTSPNKILLWVTGGQPRPPAGALEMCCSWGIHDGSSLTNSNLAPSSQGFEVIRGPSSASGWTGGDHYGGHSYTFLYTPGSYGSPIIFTPTFKMTSGTSGWFTEGAANQIVTSYALEFKQ